MGKYWRRVTAIFERQRDKGVREYGQTLEDNTGLSPLERLEMLEEELVDALVYIEHLKEVIGDADRNQDAHRRG